MTTGDVAAVAAVTPGPEVEPVPTEADHVAAAVAGPVAADVAGPVVPEVAVSPGAAAPASPVRALLTRSGRIARGAWPDLKAALAPWLVARVLVGVGMVAARVIADEVVDAADRPRALSLGLFAGDGDAFRALATGGRDALGDAGTRFFPLFGWLAGFVDPLVGGRTDLALVVVANLAALVGMAVIHRLVVVRTADRGAATLATWCVALFPGAFVLAWPYAEGLLLVTVAVALVALATQRWWLCAIAGLLAGLAHPLGVLLTVAVLGALAERWSARNAAFDDPDFLADGGDPALLAPLRFDRGVAAVAAVLAPLAGLGAVLVRARDATGRWWTPLTEQDPARGGFLDPVRGGASAIGDLLGGSPWPPDAFHAPFVLAGVALGVLAWWRFGRSWGWFGLAVVLVALSADHLASFERALALAVPLVVVLAVGAARLRLQVPLVTALAGLSTTLVTLAMLEVYVP